MHKILIFSLIATALCQTNPGFSAVPSKIITDINFHPTLDLSNYFFGDYMTYYINDEIVPMHSKQISAPLNFSQEDLVQAIPQNDNGTWNTEFPILFYGNGGIVYYGYFLNNSFIFNTSSFTEVNITSNCSIFQAIALSPTSFAATCSAKQASQLMIYNITSNKTSFFILSEITFVYFVNPVKVYHHKNQTYLMTQYYSGFYVLNITNPDNIDLVYTTPMLLSLQENLLTYENNVFLYYNNQSSQKLITRISLDFDNLTNSQNYSIPTSFFTPSINLGVEFCIGAHYDVQFTKSRFLVTITYLYTYIYVALIDWTYMEQPEIINNQMLNIDDVEFNSDISSIAITNDFIILQSGLESYPILRKENGLATTDLLFSQVQIEQYFLSQSNQFSCWNGSFQILYQLNRPFYTLNSTKNSELNFAITDEGYTSSLNHTIKVSYQNEYGFQGLVYDNNSYISQPIARKSQKTVIENAAEIPYCQVEFNSSSISKVALDWGSQIDFAALELNILFFSAFKTAQDKVIQFTQFNNSLLLIQHCEFLNELQNPSLNCKNLTKSNLNFYIIGLAYQTNSDPYSYTIALSSETSIYFYNLTSQSLTYLLNITLEVNLISGPVSYPWIASYSQEGFTFFNISNLYSPVSVNTLSQLPSGIDKAISTSEESNMIVLKESGTQNNLWLFDLSIIQTGKTLIQVVSLPDFEEFTISENKILITDTKKAKIYLIDMNNIYYPSIYSDDLEYNLTKLLSSGSRIFCGITPDYDYMHVCYNSRLPGFSFPYTLSESSVNFSINTMISFKGFDLVFMTYENYISIQSVTWSQDLFIEFGNLAQNETNITNITIEFEIIGESYSSNLTIYNLNIEKIITEIQYIGLNQTSQTLDDYKISQVFQGTLNGSFEVRAEFFSDKHPISPFYYPGYAEINFTMYYPDQEILAFFMSASGSYYVFKANGTFYISGDQYPEIKPQTLTLPNNHMNWKFEPFFYQIFIAHDQTANIFYTISPNSITMLPFDKLIGTCISSNVFFILGKAYNSYVLITSNNQQIPTYLNFAEHFEITGIGCQKFEYNPLLMTKEGYLISFNSFYFKIFVVTKLPQTTEISKEYSSSFYSSIFTLQNLPNILFLVQENGNIFIYETNSSAMIGSVLAPKGLKFVPSTAQYTTETGAMAIIAEKIDDEDECFILVYKVNKIFFGISPKFLMKTDKKQKRIAYDPDNQINILAEFFDSGPASLLGCKAYYSDLFQLSPQNNPITSRYAQVRAFSSGGYSNITYVYVPGGGPSYRSALKVSLFSFIWLLLIFVVTAGIEFNIRHQQNIIEQMNSQQIQSVV